ncbi:MAG: YcxB family protein [Limisphaerales bacterium]
MDTSSVTSSREITFDWSLNFARAVKRRHFARQIRRPGLLFLPVGIIGLFGIWLHWQKGQSGGGYWLLVCISVLPWLLSGAHHLAINQMQSLGVVPRVTVRIEPESITITSEKGPSTIKWSAIKEIWRFPDVVLLFWDAKHSLDHAFALPVASLDENLRRFIEDRVREHGGVVA